MTDQNTARRQYQNAVNNAQGQAFEGYIKAGCEYYRLRERATVDKTPEPFKVTQKHGGGVFTGRFTALALPDFQGTLAGGRSIVFEAKYTTTDRLKRGVLTDTQMSTLALHDTMGAIAGVCAGIGDKFFFVPWEAWREMRSIYKRLYVTAADIEPYRVRFTGAVLFLDYVHKTAIGGGSG